MTKLNKNSAMTPFQQCVVNGGREKKTIREIYDSMPEYGLNLDGKKKMSTFKSEMSTCFSMLENMVNTWQKDGVQKNGVELAELFKEPHKRVHIVAMENGWERVGQRIEFARAIDAGKRGRKAAVQQDFNALAAELGKLADELTLGDVAENEGIEIAE